jgi:glycosyltransferase involved in cell wall biosynthesis
MIVGGAQENTMNTAIMLNKDRYKVDILTGPQTGKEGSLIQESINRGASVIILPELVREINPLKDLLAGIKLFRKLKSNQYIIVHTHSSKAGVIGRIAAWMAGVPVIIHTVHGWSFHNHMNSWLRSLYVLLERFAASFSDTLIVVTELDINKGLREKIGEADKYRIIRSAINLEEFNPANVDPIPIRKELGIPSDVPVLGNIGRFSPQKNPMDWLDVAIRVATALPECYFLLVGDGPLRAAFEEQVEKRGINGNFILTGLRRDIPRMLSCMDVFLLTSLWEGLPRVIPQALSMGIPVIANRVDGTEEAIQDGKTGFLCLPGNLDKMAEYCINLLTNLKLRQEMSENGQKFVSNEFSLTNMVIEIESLYEELLEKKLSKRIYSS